MTQSTVTSVHGALDADELDAVAAIAAATDEGPAALDVPDIPDSDTDPDPSPRPDDGPQDVSQDPHAKEA